MWSEEINKKITEAEDSNPAAYNDKAWENMELLLDKHLPLKKKRRRFIFWLLPIVLAGTTIFFILYKKEPTVTIADQKIVHAEPPLSTDKLVAGTDDKKISQEKTAAHAYPLNTVKETNIPGVKTQELPVASTEPNFTEKSIFVQEKQKDNKQVLPSVRKKIAEKKEKIYPGNFNPPNTAEQNIPSPVDHTVNQDAVKNSTKSIHNSIAIQKAVTTTDKKQNDTLAIDIAKANIKKDKSKPSSNSKFSLNLSFGPDASNVGFNTPGKLEMQYGIGASYALSKRFSIRTGFFAGSKKYTADSADYHLHYSINNLEKVDADCYVYEIPLTLVYNFSTVKKHNWFISGGLSSYIMKKEAYKYYYKNAWGQPQSYSRTYKNENSHLFSVVNLSAGYQYHFSDRLSLMAEPYIKIATNGIGSGKVKLNSTGALFTIGFKPFLKEK